MEDDPVAGMGFVGAMCARAVRMTPGPRDDLVVITHNSSRLLIFSPL